MSPDGVSSCNVVIGFGKAFLCVLWRDDTEGLFSFLELSTRPFLRHE